MTKIRKHEFEDQGVYAISLTHGEFRLGIDCWNPHTDVKSKFLAVFTDVKNFQIDNAPSSDAKMISESGEIIHFETNDNLMLLIIEWHDYLKKKRTTKSYKFAFESLQIIKV